MHFQIYIYMDVCVCGIHTCTNLWINHILENERKQVGGRQRDAYPSIRSSNSHSSALFACKHWADKLLFLSTEWICFRNYVLTLTVVVLTWLMTSQACKCDQWRELVQGWHQIWKSVFWMNIFPSINTGRLSINPGETVPPGKDMRIK